MRVMKKQTVLRLAYDRAENKIVNASVPEAIGLTPEDALNLERIKEIFSDVKYTDAGKFTDMLEKMETKSIAKNYASASQEHGNEQSQYKGSGLGLAISAQLVSLMGGKISVNSKRDEGSDFIVEIPFEISEATVKEATEADMGNIVPFENIRVLLAEDNELNSEIASVLLRESGIEAECAANGKQACDMFFAHKEHYYDLILMDVMMPVMDGIAATKAIRSSDHPLAKTIPIVAMTANAFEDDVRKMREAGMNEHLSKPIRITEVLKTIRRVLKTSGGRGTNNP